LLKAHRNPVGKRGRTLPPARRSEGFV